MITPDEAARRLRHLAGDTEFKREEVTYSLGDLLEDLLHRLTDLADELEGTPEGADIGYEPAYELIDWDTLAEGHWV